MKIISHRGNIEGRKPECENNPSYIDRAISEGFDVEVDIWFIGDEFFLGHDAATYHIDPAWILARASSLWCHAKNFEAMEKLLLMNDVNCFWHEHDKMTLTSFGIPWLYPENYVRNGITVEFDEPKNIPDVLGICTDYPSLWRCA